MLYVRFPLSLRNVEDLLHERDIKVSHETVRFWWQRFVSMLADETGGILSVAFKKRPSADPYLPTMTLGE
jgi:hypothetical protein